MKAKAAQFYGWTDEEIARMPIKTFYQYFNCIRSIEAGQLLDGFHVSSYPNMKKQAQRDLFNKIKRIAQSIVNNSDGKLASYQDVLKKLKGQIVGKK